MPSDGPVSSQRSPSPVYLEPDIEVAAYLHAHGKVLIEVVAEPKKPYQFVFDDSEHNCLALARQFLSSPEKKYAHSLSDMRREVKFARDQWHSK
jgi:hypothetical protein